MMVHCLRRVHFHGVAVCLIIITTTMYHALQKMQLGAF